jgi:hypothetical protein
MSAKEVIFRHEPQPIASDSPMRISIRPGEIVTEIKGGMPHSSYRKGWKKTQAIYVDEEGQNTTLTVNSTGDRDDAFEGIMRALLGNIHSNTLQEDIYVYGEYLGRDMVVIRPWTWDRPPAPESKPGQQWVLLATILKPKEQ